MQPCRNRKKTSSKPILRKNNTITASVKLTSASYFSNTSKRCSIEKIRRIASKLLGNSTLLQHIWQQNSLRQLYVTSTAGCENVNSPSQTNASIAHKSHLNSSAYLTGIEFQTAIAGFSSRTSTKLQIWEHHYDSWCIFMIPICLSGIQF